MTDFQKGQTVTVAGNVTARSASGRGARYSRQFERGETGEVTKTTQNTVTVKFRNPRYHSGYGGGSKYLSYNFAREQIEAPNGEAWDANTPKPTPPRKLGTPPEGGIDPHDPRIAWLWEDAAKFADRNGYCSYYDRIADGLNIPGRKRDIRVSIKVNGLTVEATVQAQSQREAERVVREKLAAAK